MLALTLGAADSAIIGDEERAADGSMLALTLGAADAAIGGND